MLRLLVTGSDTGVGKTFCTGQLAYDFAIQKKRIQIVKPVETGVQPQSKEHDADKAKAHALTLGAEDRFIEAITLTTFLFPLAPFAAAKKENKIFLYDSLITRCLALPECDVRIYEGAGGISSPLVESGEDWTNVAADLGIDLVFLVIPDKLGSINQARLTARAVNEKLIAYGVWLNALQLVDPLVAESNREGIMLAGIPLLAENGFGQSKPIFTRFYLESLLNLQKKKTSISLLDHIAAELKERDQKNLLRTLQVYKPDLALLNLSDNDYLALSHDPQLIAAAKESLSIYGTSASASPLISGWTSAHELLLKELCVWHGFSSGLIWSSGYAANTAILGTLPKKGDVIFADKLIHNSMISGIKRSGAQLKRYPHLDLDVLERLLHTDFTETLGQSKHTRFLVTESVFSMDGDYPDLKRIAALKKQYPFIWILDEAHALGWYGKHGAGLAEEIEVTDSVDILVGTLGKTLASGGAYCLMHETIIRDYLINHAGEFIYSTSLAPSNAATATAAIKRIHTLIKDQHLWRTQSRQLREAITQLGFVTLPGESPIVPVFLNREDTALALANDLKKAGVAVAAIRPLTVPAGTSRLRISLKRGISDEQINKLLTVMKHWRSQ